MEHTEPPEPSPEGTDSEPAGPADVLRRLEQRLDRASNAAERLLAEAARASAASAARLAESAARAARPGGAEPDAAKGPRAGRAGNEPPTADGTTPPGGWQVRSEDARADLEVLSQVIQSLRELIPPDVQRRLADALRELLLAVRALIDWYLERVEQRRTEPAEVQDIPIL
jgi:hypothetical protein